jgi:Asp-tRNA(Asn)/Glu-tRNA(Gln) amidotransferase A subunit family amidase
METFHINNSIFANSIMKNLVSALILVLFFGCSNQAPKQVIDLSELTIGDIHKAYKNGSYSSEELVSAYLDRIAAFDDQLNSISIVNPEALTIAKALDKEYKETKTLRPLHGIPIIVKDNINTVGMPTSAGALALAEFMPDENAFIIQNLINAGAIILAKSNMAEWAFSPMHTESSTIGITRNPYNLDYVPAGSSGGTAASVAANFALLGLGTDTGNSIRGPSSHCSLVGFRTTLGLISRSGIVPLFLRNDVVGPMGRTVEDATRVMEVMAGFDPTDSITAHAEDQIAPDYIQFLKKDGLVGARIGVLRVLCDENTDPEILAVFGKALLDLDELGAKIIDSVVIADFDILSENQWCGTFRKDVEAFLATYVKNDTIKTLEDVIRIGTHSEFAQRRLEAYSSMEGRWGKAQLACLDAYTDPARIAFREAIENMMDSLELDAIIYPTWTQKPAHIAYFEEEYGGDNSQSISPHTGQPAFTVPMGYVSEGLPVGLQFLGRMYAEPTLIKLCYAYEQGTQHRKPPVIITSVKRI